MEWRRAATRRAAGKHGFALWLNTFSSPPLARRQRTFIEYRLTPAERELVRLACTGLDNAALARQLHKSKRTVANQFTAIYEKLCNWQSARGDLPANRHSLIAEFASYFATEIK